MTAVTVTVKAVLAVAAGIGVPESVTVSVIVTGPPF